MAMDDIYRLTQAVMIDGEMACSEQVDPNCPLIPIGPWKTAHIRSATLHVHNGSWYEGSVNYHIVGENCSRIATFNDLWIQGWTTVEFMRECIATQKKEAQNEKRRAQRKAKRVQS
jgi:hypothetical protein